MGPASPVLLASMLAGASALAAETLWVRALGRGLGTTPEALAAVTGLFLAGLGLGAGLGARTAPICERPARTAARALIGAGLLVGLSPHYAAFLPDLHVALLDMLGSEGSSAWAALPLAAPLVLGAALLFGLAFPYLVRARIENLAHTGGRTGGVYALNALGAPLGIAGALLLLPEAGEATALRAAGGVALLGALCLVLADRPLPHGTGPPAGVAPALRTDARWIGPALGASGAAALMAQMGWFRMLEPLAGDAFGIAFLLGPVLVALALGAALGGVLADRTRRPEALLRFCLVAGGALTMLSIATAGGVPLQLVQAGPDGRLGALLGGFARTSGPAMLAFGAALPLAVKARAEWTGRAAGAAGVIYAWNTAGALVGSVLGGFLLLPALGAERALLIAGTLVIVAGAGLRVAAGGRRHIVGAAVHLLPLVVLLVPGMLRTLLDEGPSVPEIIASRRPVPPGLHLREREDLRLYARWFAGERARRPGAASGALLPVFEGRMGRVALIEEPDGHVGLRRGVLREAVFAPDLPDQPSLTEVLLALLPELFRPGSSRALVIGHGAGWTAEAALAGDVGRLDVAEIDRAVLDAARAYRGVKQLAVERDPRAHLIHADGRVLLRRAAARPDGARYDWIASQPSHPWSAAAGHLFTREAFATARAALADDGVLAQWINVFDMTPQLLRDELATFHAVFEHTWVFRVPGELLLLGFVAPPRIDVTAWERRLGDEGDLAAVARAVDLDGAGDVFKHLVLDTPALERALTGPARWIVDDVPRLEFALARRRLEAHPPRAAEAVVLEAFPPDVKALVPDVSVRERWLAGATMGWLDAGRVGEAETWSRRLRWGGSAGGKMAQAAAAFASGDTKRAEGLLERALSQDPARGEAAARLIEAMAANMGDGAEIEQVLERIAAIANAHAEDGRVLAAAARAYRHVGHMDECIDYFERALAAEVPPQPGTRVQLARVRLTVGEGAADEERARVLLAGDPTTYSRVDALDMLMRLTGDAGRTEEARTLEQALRSLQEAEGLRKLRQAAGLLSRHAFRPAAEAAREAGATWPWHPAPPELRGLALLAARASEAAAGSAPGEPDDAIGALRDAVARSDDAPAAYARARRILAWFDIAPERLGALPTTAGED
jgi:spermidine synthase